MNKEEIDDIKNRTQGILYITKHKKFWNYFDKLQQENKALKKEIEMCYKKIDNLMLSRDKAIEFLELAKESGVISIRTIEEILKGE